MTKWVKNLNKLKRSSLLVMAFLMLSCPVLSVSAAGTADGEKTKTYYYFINGSGTRHNFFKDYFTYEVRAEVEATTLLAAYWDPASISYGYDSYTIISLSNGNVYSVGSTNAPKVVSYDIIEDTGVFKRLTVILV